MRSSINKAVVLAAAFAAFGFLPGAASAAGDISVTGVNKSGEYIKAIHISATGKKLWGPDLIGKNKTVAPDVEFSFTFQAPTEADCYYDLKASFSNGKEVVRNNINLCKQGGEKLPILGLGAK